VYRGSLDHRVYRIFRLEVQLAGRLCGHYRHQRETAIQLDTRQGALPNHRSDSPGQAVSRTRSRRGLGSQRHLFGANAGEHRAGLSGIDALNVGRSHLDGGQSSLARNNLPRQDVFHADGLGDRHIRWMPEDLFERACLADTAVNQDHHPIAERQGLDAVVGDDDAGDTAFHQFTPQRVTQAGAGSGVER